MTIVKPMRLGLISRAQQEPPKVYFFVTALGYFDLLQPGDFDLETRMWPMVAAAMGGTPLDVGMPKPCGEVLVIGAAAAAGGQPVTQMAVEFAVGPVRKRLTVIGDRYWELTSDGPVFTRPQPFTRMPLSWDRAFGGPEFPENPAGTGHGAPAALSAGRLVRLPNIEDASDLIMDVGQVPAPVGCAPLDVMVPARQRFTGTYDDDWLKRLHPGHAADFQWAFYNTAPRDQWLPGFLNGDERIRISGMHPDHPVIDSRLPGMRVRAFLDLERDQVRTLTEVDMRCETVVLFPDRLKGVVIYRGGCEIADIDGRDVVHTLLAYERLGEPPRDAGHYARVLKARTDPETAALSFFDEKPLRPAVAEAELAERQAERDAAAAARDEKWDLRTEAAVAQAYAAMGALPPPPGSLPKSRPPVAIPAVTPMDIERMDVDMVGVMAALNKLRAYGDEQIAAARQQAATVLGELAGLSAGAGRGLLDAASIARIRNAGAQLPAPPAGASAVLPTDLPTLESLRQELAAKDPAEPDPFEAVISALQAAGADGGPLSDDERAVLRARAQGRPEAGVGAPMLAEIAKLDPTAGGRVDPASPPATGADPGGVDAFLQQLGLAGPAGMAETVGAVVAAVDRLGPGAAVVKPLLAATPPPPEQSLAESVERAKAAAQDAAGQIETAFATARRMSPEPLAPLEPLTAEAARYLGEAVCECLAVDADVSGRDWAGAELTGVSFAGRDLRGAMFEGANLSRADFRGAMLEDAVFTGATLAGADFSGCAMRGANLSAVEAAGARFARSDLTDARLFQARLARSDLSGVTLDSSIALNADLTGADLSGARITKVILITPTLDDAILDRAELFRCIVLQGTMQRVSARGLVLSRSALIDCKLPDGDFTGADFSDSGSLGGSVYDGSVMRFLVAPRSGWHAASMKLVDLLGARLDGADLGKADLSGSRLRRASLRRAVLLETVLANADATAADFLEATLRRADLRGASLRQANLYRAGIDAADLANCDLTGVNATGTNLMRVADVAG